MKWRYVLWMLIPVFIAGVLLWWNTEVPDMYFTERVMPFAMMDIAKLMMIAVLLVQHPGPPHGLAWWKRWRAVDPVVLVLIATLLPSIIYYLMLVGGNSMKFKAPDWGYDVARFTMLVFGWVAISLWCEFLYRGVKSRVDNRRHRYERFDMSRSDEGAV